MKGLTQVDNKGKNAAGKEVKPVFPGKSLPWETTNYGFVPVEVEAVCVQCVYSVCIVCAQWPSSAMCVFSNILPKNRISFRQSPCYFASEQSITSVILQPGVTASIFILLLNCIYITQIKQNERYNFLVLDFFFQ